MAAWYRSQLLPAPLPAVLTQLGESRLALAAGDASTDLAAPRGARLRTRSRLGVAVYGKRAEQFVVRVENGSPICDTIIVAYCVNLKSRTKGAHALNRAIPGIRGTR